MIFECASAFNCGMIAFENIDMGRVPSERFPWQQQHDPNSRRQLFAFVSRMGVTKEDRVMIKNLYSLKGYGAKNLMKEFLT